MPGLIETNIHGIWAEKQSAQGVPATTGSTRFRLTGGNTMVAQPDMQSQAFSDGTAFGDAVDWLNSLVGQGQPAFAGGTDELAWLLWLFHGAETVTPSGTNAVQTLTITGTPTGGTFALTFDGRTTAPIPFNAAGAAVQAALEALPNIGTGNVLCGAGTLPASAITITFQGALAKRPVPLITDTSSLTGGTSPDAAVANTTPGTLAVHTFAPQNALGFWSSWWQSVGADNVQRLKHNDVRLGGIQIEASSGSKTLTVSPQLLGLDPAEIFSTDPVLPMPQSPILGFTEFANSWTVDGIVIRGTTQFQLQLSYGINPAYGDDVTPYGLERGTPSMIITATTKADDVMMARWNNWLYGTPTPAAGTKPIKRVPPLGSFSCAGAKKDTANNTIGSFSFGAPGVRWQIPASVAPNPGQGSGEISLTGNLRRLGSQALYSMAVGCQKAAFTA